MMKLDGDEEATPGAKNSSHKTEDAHERTVPPWTKKKDPPTAKEEDEEVASVLHQSKQSPHQHDSDPPLKKAKLFIATSASSGTASPQSTESRSSQKRPASTELSRTASSESDGELSGDDGKVSPFIRTGAGEASRGVMKFPNQAKRAATESLVGQSVASQTLDDSTPPYPSETDHNYGRASDGSSDSSVVDEATSTETKEVNVSSVAGAETTECINSASLPSLPATPDSVIQSTHPAAEARRPEGQEPTQSTAELGSSTEHVNNRDGETSRETLDPVRPNEKHEEHETEVPLERTSREPDSRNHIDGKTVEPLPPAETSDPSSSNGKPSVTVGVNLSASLSERSGLVEPEDMRHLTGPGAELRAEEILDPAPEELKPDIMTQQNVTEPTGVTEALRKAGLESNPASNQTTATNCYQEQVLAGPSEVSVTPAETRGLPQREDEAQVKTLLTLEKTPTAEPVLSDLVAPSVEDNLAKCSGVHPVVESLGSQSAVQADLGERNRAVSVAEESIAAPETSAEVHQVHDVQELDDSTVSSSTEVVVTNREEHVGRMYECVTVQESEITSNLDSTTPSQGICDVVPAENTQPEVMKNVDTSTQPEVMKNVDTSTQPEVMQNVDTSTKHEVMQNVDTSTQPGNMQNVDTSTQPGNMQNVDTSTQPGNLQNVDTSTQPGNMQNVDTSTQPGNMQNVDTSTQPGNMQNVDTSTQPGNMQNVDTSTQPEDMQNVDTSTQPEDMQNVDTSTQPEDMQNVDTSTQPEDMQNVDTSTQPEDMQNVDTSTQPEDMQNVDTSTQPGNMQNIDTSTQPGNMQNVDTSTQPGNMQNVDTSTQPEVMQNVDTSTQPEVMQNVDTSTQPEVMQNVDTSTGTSSDVSAQVTVTNPDRRQTCVSEHLTVQETHSTPNLVSTTTDPIPAEKTRPDGTQHLDVTLGTSSNGPKHLPNTESEVVSEWATGEEVQPEVNLSSSTVIFEEKPDLVDTEATMEEEVSQKVDNESSHGRDHMVVRPLISEEQENVNVESTATLEVSNSMPTEGTLHYKEPCTDFSEVSTHVSSANGQNNVFVSECVAETSINMDSTASDEQIPGQAQAIMEGGHHRETHPADNSSVDIDTQVPQHVMMNAGSKEGETVSSEYVPEQKTGMEVTTSNMSLPAPTEDLEDKEIQMVNNDCTGVSREAPTHQTLSTSDMVTSDCVGDQDTAPYMEMTETKPDLSNQAQEYENPDEKDQCMEQSIGMSEDRAGQLMSKNVEPKEKYVIFSQSIPIQTPQIEAELSTMASLQKASLLPKKEIQTQKNDMAMDKHVFIATSQTSQNEDKINESHAGHGGQTNIIADSFTTSEITDEDGQQKVNSTHLSPEDSTHSLMVISENAVNEDVITSECAAIPEAEPDEDMQTTSTPEEMHEPGTKEHGGDQGNHSVNEHAPTEDKEKADMFDKMEAGLHTAASDGVPNSVPAAQQQIQVIHEEPITVEEGCLISNAELMNKKTTMEAVAYVTSGDQREEGEITSMEAKAHSVFEKEKQEARLAVDEVEVNTPLCSTTRQCEAQVNSEVIVFVCGQQEGDVVVESSTVNKPDAEDVTEQMETVIQSEGEAKDFQVVYEAISSPESTIDEEVSVVPGVPGNILLPDTHRMESQEVEGNSVAISTTSEVNVPLSPTQEADEQINGKTPACLPDSQSDVDIETMICEVTAESSEALPIKHTNGAVDITDVLVEDPESQVVPEAGVLEETTNDNIPKQNIQNTEERREVLVVTTSDEVPEQNIQNTEERRDVLVVTTSDEVPEQNIQNTEEIVDLLVETTSNHVPEPNIQKTDGMGDVLLVTTCDSMPELTMQQMEGMGDEKEANKAPESVEMQKDNGPPELPQETLISTAMASSETPDSSSQEEVMESLTIPESADHMDIITQAAAASGLTTSLSEHLNSDGQMVEADQILNLNRTSQSFYSAIDVHQYQGMDQSTRTSSNEESREDPEVKYATDAAPVALLEKDIPSVPNADQQEEQSAEKKHDATEHEMENPAVCEPQTPAYENASVEMIESVDASSENAEGDMQILVDIELGHQVEVQDESEMDDPDIVIIEKSHSAVEMPPVEVENSGEKSPTNNADSTPSNADNSSQKAEETINKTSTPSVTPNPKAEVTVEKPKKQQMNTQARTKARLAALAEQKAAASKRAAQRQQLNLLALCEEIAEDIATDSMLLKRIEEEKLAAAAKMEAMKKESPPVDKQEATSVPPSPAGPQASSPLVNTVDEASSAKPTTTTAEPAETKPVAPEPPKRRFFVSQIVVPLKAHEKKKLTRYQRLRQVELQREKMSWTRVKKLKTDQAHQMLFSDIDFDSSNPFLMPPVATPLTPVANMPVTADTSTASTSTSTPSALPATPEVPDAATTKPDQSKAVVTTPDPSPMVMTPDPSTTVTTPDPSKAVTTKPEPKETATPKPGRPRREATTPKVNPAKVECSKVESQKAVPPKVTAAEGPTAKVTRSSTRKTLPAKPPPMPNGMNTQKAKSEMEYKPYRPRPKYSIEDFELDDDPPPVLQRRPMPQPRPGQQAGPSQQSTSTTQVQPTLQSTNPTAQSRTTPPSKPMFSSELAGQTKPKLQGTPAQQISGQSTRVTSTPVQSRPATSTPVQSRPLTSKPVASTTSQSKPTTSATGQLKSTASNTSQSKPVIPTVHSKPVAPIVSQSKPCIAAAPQPKTTIAATAQPISAVPAKPTQKNQVLDTVGPVPGKALPSSSPAPQTSTAGPTTPQPKPQPGSLKEEVEVKPAVETPAETLVSIPAGPQPDVFTETQSVQPPTRPNNFKFQVTPLRYNSQIFINPH